MGAWRTITQPIISLLGKWSVCGTNWQEVILIVVILDDKYSLSLSHNFLPNLQFFVHIIWALEMDSFRVAAMGPNCSSMSVCGFWYSKSHGKLTNFWSIYSDKEIVYRGRIEKLTNLGSFSLTLAFIFWSYFEELEILVHNWSTVFIYNTARVLNSQMKI